MRPRHIGFIMDGNGRWATAHNLPRVDGYAEGLIALRRVAIHCSQLGIEAISVYAFSTENWARPSAEIDTITNVVKHFNCAYEGNLKITYMGNMSELNDELVSSIEAIENNTRENFGMALNIAFNYGGRADILHAAQLACDHGEFVEDAFETHLSSSHLPPLDLVVRTGGEQRLSGFMLYEAAYSELIFLEKLWPEMAENDVEQIVAEYENRKRKFGA